VPTSGRWRTSLSILRHKRTSQLTISDSFVRTLSHQSARTKGLLPDGRRSVLWFGRAKKRIRLDKLKRSPTSTYSCRDGTCRKPPAPDTLPLNPRRLA
jgi:hypothetical protein